MQLVHVNSLVALVAPIVDVDWVTCTGKVLHVTPLVGVRWGAARPPPNGASFPPVRACRGGRIRGQGFSVRPFGFLVISLNSSL